MCHKNKYLFELKYQRGVILEMLEEVWKFDMTRENKLYPIKNLEEMSDFIEFIIGLERPHFEMMKKFANKIGWFDDKVQDLF